MIHAAVLFSRHSPRQTVRPSMYTRGSAMCDTILQSTETVFSSILNPFRVSSDTSPVITLLKKCRTFKLATTELYVYNVFGISDLERWQLYDAVGGRRCSVIRALYSRPFTSNLRRAILLHDSWSPLQMSCDSLPPTRTAVLAGNRGRVHVTDSSEDGVLLVINVKKTKFINDGYRRRNFTSKTAKIHRFVGFVMYCFITAVPVAFY